MKNNVMKIMSVIISLTMIFAVISVAPAFNVGAAYSYVVPSDATHVSNEAELRSFLEATTGGNVVLDNDITITNSIVTLSTKSVSFYMDNHALIYTPTDASTTSAGIAVTASSSKPAFNFYNTVDADNPTFVNNSANAKVFNYPYVSGQASTTCTFKGTINGNIDFSTSSQLNLGDCTVNGDITTTSMVDLKGTVVVNGNLSTSNVIRTFAGRDNVGDIYSTTDVTIIGSAESNGTSYQNNYKSIHIMANTAIDFKGPVTINKSGNYGYAGMYIDPTAEATFEDDVLINTAASASQLNISLNHAVFERGFTVGTNVTGKTLSTSGTFNGPISINIPMIVKSGAEFNTDDITFTGTGKISAVEAGVYFNSDVSSNSKYQFSFCSLVPATDSEHIGMYVTVAPTSVCKIGTTDYASFNAAFAAAVDGDTIVLTDDAKVEQGTGTSKGENSKYQITNNLTIDLAGHKLTDGYSAGVVSTYNSIFNVTEGKTLTITDSTDKTGVLDICSGRGIIVQKDAVLNVVNAKIVNRVGENSDWGIMIEAIGSGATVSFDNSQLLGTIKGAAAASTTRAGYGIRMNAASTVLSVKNSTIQPNGDAISVKVGSTGIAVNVTGSTVNSACSNTNYIGLDASASGTYTVTDSRFVGAGMAFKSANANANVTINNTTFSSSVNSDGSLYATAGNVVINNTDSNVTGHPRIAINNNGANITINGGYYYSTGTDSTSKVGLYNTKGTTVINGGHFGYNNTKATRNKAAIYAAAGTVTINGGVFYGASQMIAGTASLVSLGATSVAQEEGTSNSIADITDANATKTKYVEVVNTDPSSIVSFYDENDNVIASATKINGNVTIPNYSGNLGDNVKFIGFTDGATALYKAGETIAVDDSAHYVLVKAEIETLDGAAVRWSNVDEKAGIKFTTRINKADFAKLLTLETSDGQGVVSEATVGATIFDENGKQLNVTNDTSSKGVSAGWYDEDSTYVYFHSAATEFNQNEDYMKLKLYAKGYINITYTNGQSATFEANTSSHKTLLQVAVAAYADADDAHKAVLTRLYGVDENTTASDPNLFIANEGVWESGWYTNTDGQKTAYTSGNRICYSKLIFVETGVTYAFSLDKVSSTSTAYDDRFYVFRGYDENGTFIASLDSGISVSNGTVTFTNPAVKKVSVTMYDGVTDVATLNSGAIVPKMIAQ